MRNPEETRRRLLEAATAEFAAHGIAGARVDRIADSAGCNKQSIYGYFGSKDGLFEAVLDAIVARAVSEVPVDARDLPGYAGRVFDWYGENPEVLRLWNWMQLEQGNPKQMSEAMAAAGANKREKVREAQQAGVITDAIPADQLLGFVTRLASAQIDYCSLDRGERSTLRAALVEAVRRLVAP